MKSLFRSTLYAMLSIMALSFVACNDDKHTPPTTDTTPNYEWYYTIDDGNKVEIKSVSMTQHEERIVILFSPTEGELSPENIATEHARIELPISSIGSEVLLSTDANVVVYTALSCFASPVGINYEEAEAIESGSLTITDNGDYSFAIDLCMTLGDGSQFEAFCVGECTLVEIPARSDVENTFSYEWTNRSIERTVDSAFVEDTPEGVIYTLCVDNIKTYVSYEDTIFLRMEVSGRSASDSFDIDIATSNEKFTLWLCDSIHGMNLRASNESREYCSGTFSVNRGVVVCDICYNPPKGDDILFSTTYDDGYRTVNECIDIVYDERTSLFTPQSVIVDNSGEEYKIYVSSKEGVTTLAEMADAEVIITYPADGWSTLTSGNFVSGSSHPAMNFTLYGKRYIKGKGDILGMNCQFPMYDAESRRLRLNANLYDEQGGVALYFSGSFTLIE